MLQKLLAEHFPNTRISYHNYDNVAVRGLAVQAAMLTGITELEVVQTGVRQIRLKYQSIESGKPVEEIEPEEPLRERKEHTDI